jgi:hypothetical protein
MSPDRFIILALVLTLFVGCASVPSQASFTQQILDPLSKQIADQKIDQRKAEIARGRLDPGLMSTLGSIVAPTVGYPATAGAEMGSLMAGFLNSSIEHDLALVESRRSALKEELFTRYEQGTKRIDNRFAVCVEGQEHQYMMEHGNFTRSSTDGPGPCEQTSLQITPVPLERHGASRRTKSQDVG